MSLKESHCDIDNSDIWLADIQKYLLKIAMKYSKFTAEIALKYILENHTVISGLSLTSIGQTIAQYWKVRFYNLYFRPEKV